MAMTAAERRTQVMDAARALFLARGYEATTIDEILGAVGIARGTLYHHFAGKEAILEAIVLRTGDQIAERAEAAAADPSGPAVARVLAVLAAARVSDADIELAQQLRASGNVRFHLLSITQTYARLVPVLTQVVADGVAAGELSTPDPRASVEVVLAAGLTVLDGGIFPPDDADPAADLARRQAELLRTVAALLGADPAGLAQARSLRHAASMPTRR